MYKYNLHKKQYNLRIYFILKIAYAHIIFDRRKTKEI